MCTVVQCLTRDFLRLVNLLKSCNGTITVVYPPPLSYPLQDFYKSLLRNLRTPQLSPADGRSLSMLILIVSLLCEHCDFDHLSEQREGMYELSPA
jgi:cohesin loading factor subunit SCC2